MLRRHARIHTRAILRLRGSPVDTRYKVLRR